MPRLSRGGRQGGLCRAEYGHEVLAHLARIADALRDAERIEAFQDLDGERSADPGCIAILRSGKQSLGAGARHYRGIGGERRQRRLGIEAVIGDAHQLAGPALSVQQVFEDRLLQPQAQRQFRDRWRREAGLEQRRQYRLPHPLIRGIEGRVVSGQPHDRAAHLELARIGQFSQQVDKRVRREIGRELQAQRLELDARGLRLRTMKFGKHCEHPIAKRCGDCAWQGDAPLPAKHRRIGQLVQRSRPFGGEIEHGLEPREIDRLVRGLQHFGERRFGARLFQCCKRRQACSGRATRRRRERIGHDAAAQGAAGGLVAQDVAVTI